MAGGRHAAGVRSGTPRGELARIRESREQQDSETHAKILEAMLETCGEKGFRSVAVRDVLARYGGNRVQFYRHFASKADCYAAAYEFGADRLCERILGAATAAPSWRLGLRRALGELACFVEENPLSAKGLLIEVHVAGGPALQKRTEVIERLTHAIDGARRETESRHSPPPVTAEFMIGAIESTVINALVTGEPQAFAAAVPDLTHMIVATYFGEAAAAEELAAATAA